MPEQYVTEGAAVLGPRIVGQPGQPKARRALAGGPHVITKDTALEFVPIKSAAGIIAKEQSIDRLRAWLAAERVHPTHEGGRTGIIEMLRDRIDELVNA